MHIQTERDYLDADESGLSTSLVGMVGPDLARQFQKDMLSEQAFRVFTARQRQAEIAKQNAGKRRALANGSRHVMEVDLEAYLEWHQREKGCWSDRGFLREFARDNENVRIEQATGGASNRVAWTPEMDAGSSSFGGILITDKRGTVTDLYTGQGEPTLMEQICMDTGGAPA
jgi:hypothetical protein